MHFVPSGTSTLNATYTVVNRAQLPYTVFIQIKRMIQSSTRNSILGIYGWIQLSASCHYLILGWSNLPQYQEWSLSVVPTLWQQKAVKNEKELPSFFDQMMRLLAAGFCVATIQVWHLFHWKARCRHTNDCWILAVVHVTSQFCCQPWKRVVQHEQP